MCPKISIDILLELIVSALKTDKCSLVEKNDVHNYPGYENGSGRVSTICTVILSGARPDLVA